MRTPTAAPVDNVVEGGCWHYRAGLTKDSALVILVILVRLAVGVDLAGIGGVLALAGHLGIPGLGPGQQVLDRLRATAARSTPSVSQSKGPRKAAKTAKTSTTHRWMTRGGCLSALYAS